MRLRRQRLREYLYPLLGLLTVLALGVFVYVSYTADRGLPFASNYKLNAAVSNADRLITTDEVRIGGIRVGQVSSVSAEVDAHGRPYALLGLSLSPGLKPLPVDTLVEVQSSSVLGQTYVDLVPGHSPQRVHDGGTLPLSDSRTAVELTDLFDIFNRSTARAIQSTIGSFAYGVAGRGPALNQTFGGLAQLLPPFAAVSQNLAAPRTHLAGFVTGLSEFARSLAPVSGELGSLVAGADVTFAALDASRGPLGATVNELPGAETAATDALASLQTPLNALASLTVRLRAAAALLPRTVSGINTTLRAGVPVVDALPRFAQRLEVTLATLQRISQLKTTPGALRQLVAALSALRPLLAVVTPAQLDCNIAGLYGRNFSSAWGTLGTGIGPSYVVAGVVTPGAQGEGFQAAAPASNLHINYLPHENAQECESGNEPFSSNQQDLANPPGNQSRSVPKTSPPPGISELARSAGLLTAPPGTPR